MDAELNELDMLVSEDIVAVELECVLKLDPVEYDELPDVRELGVLELDSVDWLCELNVELLDELV